MTIAVNVVGHMMLVHGAGGGEETHGQYGDNCKVGMCVDLSKFEREDDTDAPGRPSASVLNPEGDKT